MKYINQLAYPHIPYRTNTTRPELPESERNRTVAKSGCGLCCASMVVDYLTDRELSIEDCVRLSEDNGASPRRGTSMHILGPVLAEKFDLLYQNTNDLSEAITHLQRGGAIIAHVRVPENAEIGLFTKGGHYILLLATDGKEFSILDPSYTEGKFDIPERAGKVDDKNAPYLYCDVNLVHAETADDLPKYHLFSRKRR